MRESDIVSHISNLKNIPKKYVKAVIDCYVETIFETLVGGNDFGITGFGAFKVKTIGAKKGRNPKTGEVVDVPEKKSVKFKPSKNIKDCLNSVGG